MLYQIKRIAFGITMLVLLLAGGAGAATLVNSCGTISSPGEYILNSNLISSTTCISITSNDVILDGAGYSIIGQGIPGTSGVYVYSPSITLINVTVKYLNVTNWSLGIYYENVLNGNISNSTASNNSWGVGLFSSDNSTVKDNTVSNNYDGIVLCD